MMHHIYSMMLGGRLYLAPIPRDCSRILDIGTGTGIWAIGEHSRLIFET